MKATKRRLASHWSEGGLYYSKGNPASYGHWVEYCCRPVLSWSKGSRPFFLAATAGLGLMLRPLHRSLIFVGSAQFLFPAHSLFRTVHAISLRGVKRWSKKTAGGGVCNRLDHLSTIQKGISKFLSTFNRAVRSCGS